jgi:cyclopropane fatty-acyl-phospholipid synthase-like methyltransferase
MQHHPLSRHSNATCPAHPSFCEAIQESRFFDRTFDAVLAWGLMFLLKSEDQHRLIQRFAEILVLGGRLLFTQPFGTMQ